MRTLGFFPAPYSDIGRILGNIACEGKTALYDSIAKGIDVLI